MPLPHKNSGDEYLVHTDAFWNKSAQSDTKQSDTNVDLKLRISELETELAEREIKYNNYKEEVLAWRRKDKEDYKAAIARVEETLARYKHVLKGYIVDSYFIETDQTSKQILDKKRREAYYLLKKYTLTLNTNPEKLDTDWVWISEDKVKFESLHIALKKYLAETEVDGYAVQISDLIG
jgi:hypothetical protein